MPTIPDLHKTVYAACLVPEALDMSDFHACNTTHCWAGWIINLAGEKGYALEEHTDPVFAAMQISKASDPENLTNPCWFFGSNEDALANMKRLAEAGGRS